MKFTLTFCCVLLLALQTQAAELIGPAEVIDGRTLKIAGNKVRLHGIDVPALTQNCTWPGKKKSKTIPCGKLAKWALMDLVIGTKVTCTWKTPDKFLAICSAGGFDLGRNMVHTGWALADRNQTKRYVATEQEAKAAKRGIWKGTFTPPPIWRATQTRQE